MKCQINLAFIIKRNEFNSNLTNYLIKFKYISEHIAARTRLYRRIAAAVPMGNAACIVEVHSRASTN